MWRVVNVVDALITGRPPRVIERRFGWLRDMGYAVEESGWRGMELYATYASKGVLVRVLDDYHYGSVGVWLARDSTGEGDWVGSDVGLEQLLAMRAPGVRWDPNYDIDARSAGEAKLTEAARLLREHCVDLLRGENLDVLAREMGHPA